jgi:transcriptional regulator GlxA family with amidase domain
MSIGLLAFPDMELIDYAGPYQTFATASRIAGGDAFSLVTIGASREPVVARAGATLLPDVSVADQLALDCLIIPGGMHDRSDETRATLTAWIAAQAEMVPIIASVCTGAFYLAAAGLLDGRDATTHWAALDTLRERYPAVNVIEKRRWVDSGRIVTSAGMTAGIDMALHLVERLADADLATATAKRLEL